MKKPILNFQLSLLLFLLGMSIFPLSAQNEKSDKTESPYFFVKSDNLTEDQLPLKSTQAEVNITGVIADVTIKQVYKNEGQNTLEATYVFPISTKAAIYGMTMTIGNRTIKAEIQEKNKARVAYNTAKAAGKRTSLLEQQRPNVFQMNVANIIAGDEITVELKYTELLVPDEGIYEFVYPTVVGPRYTETQNLMVANTANFTATPYTKAEELPTYQFDIQTNIEAGMPIESILSPSHRIDVNYNNITSAEITLESNKENAGNRDYILQYQLAGTEINTGLILHKGEKENFFLLMVQPPKKVEIAKIAPREYIFVIDVSGSMRGFPLDISKKLLRNLIINLRPTDRFNVLLFAGTSGMLAEESLAATKENIQLAMNVIDNQSGGGGTRLLPALKKGMNLPRCEANLSRSFIIVTDGYISVEPEVFDLIRTNLNQSNLFSFGIGSSINRHLIEGMAHVGMGEPLVITKPEGAAKQAEKFRQYINAPVLTNVKADFEGFEAYDMNPVAIPDVMGERPIILFGKWKGIAKGKITIKGLTANGTYEKTFDVSTAKPSTKNDGLKYLWAREKIKLLDDYNQLRQTDERIKEVTQLGLDYNLMTAYTSFIAIDNEIVNGDGGVVKTVRQPLPMPAGVTNSAVGFEVGSIRKIVRNSVQAKRSKKVFPTIKKKASNFVKEGRKSITFIMGADEKAKNPYYAEANNYYRYNEAGKTDEVIDTCRSLWSIKKYMEAHKPTNGLPWGKVNVVVHSNEWTGLSMPVFPNGERINTDLLTELKEAGTFESLDAAIADAKTHIQFQSCGLGRNDQLVQALQALFNSEDCAGLSPNITASPYFVFYESEKYKGIPILTKKSKAKVWYAFYKTGYREGDIKLSRQLNKRYPNANIDWRKALKEKNADNEAELFHYKFTIPIEWIVTYENKADRPDLTTKVSQQEWLKEQPELLKVLADYNIKMDKFRWTFKNTAHTFEDGMIESAILAKGLCTVVCILKME